MIKVEVVGLLEGGRGRNCSHHAVCGKSVQTGMILQLKSMQIVNDAGVAEKAVGVYAIEGEETTCLVGFLCRFAIQHRRFYHNRRVRVVTLLSESENPAIWQRSHAMRGSCMTVLIDE